jgi:hypothetical protein
MSSFSSVHCSLHALRDLDLFVSVMIALFSHRSRLPRVEDVRAAEPDDP